MGSFVFFFAASGANAPAMGVQKAMPAKDIDRSLVESFIAEGTQQRAEVIEQHRKIEASFVCNLGLCNRD